MSKHPLPHQKAIVPQQKNRRCPQESIPELIDLREEEEVPPPSPPKRAHCPTTLGLDKKITTPAERPQFLLPPFPKVKLRQGWLWLQPLKCILKDR